MELSDFYNMMNEGKEIQHINAILTRMKRGYSLTIDDGSDTYKIYQDGILYSKLQQFLQQTVDEFYEKVEKMQA